MHASNAHSEDTCKDTGVELPLAPGELLITLIAPYTHRGASRAGEQEIKGHCSLRQATGQLGSVGGRSTLCANGCLFSLLLLKLQCNW